jgi:hypothetical protein
MSTQLRIMLNAHFGRHRWSRSFVSENQTYVLKFLGKRHHVSLKINDIFSLLCYVLLAFLTRIYGLPCCTLLSIALSNLTFSNICRCSFLSLKSFLNAAGKLSTFFTFFLCLMSHSIMQLIHVHFFCVVFTDK